jgi:hypothetical protein
MTLNSDDDDMEDIQAAIAARAEMEATGEGPIPWEAGQGRARSDMTAQVTP